MGELLFVGRAGFIAGYGLLFSRDHVRVLTKDGMHTFEAPNYGTAIGDLIVRPGAAIGWAQMPDGAEILYFYDRDDDGFGYALNITDPDMSEWGYAPFRVERDAA